MPLKEFIEAHPLSVFLGIVIATISGTAGFVTYVESSKYDSAKISLEIEHKSEVLALKTRLVSIERRLGEDEKTYFDVSRLVITPDQVKALDQQYQTAPENLFFYVIPSGDRWKYDTISEGELLRLKLGDVGGDSILSKLADVLVEKNIHIWRDSNVMTVLPAAKDGMADFAPKSLNFFPMVSVQVLSEKQFKSAMNAMSSAVDDISQSILSKEMEKILTDAQVDSLEPSSASESEPGTTSPVSSGVATNTLATEVGGQTDDQGKANGQAKIEAEELLTKLWRGDLIGQFLVAIISTAEELTNAYEGVEVKFDSIQKKGNVLYLQLKIYFASVKILGVDAPQGLTVDREVFVVTNSKGLYVVTVEVPSTDGRSDAYAWVGQWLSGIRIPI